jgi:WD40 repeat protein
MSEIPISDWTWINAAADRFERAWKQGPRPRIEDYLAEVDEARRPRLLEELLRVEIELRRRAGEVPVLEEYRDRFPRHAALMEAVLGPGPGRSTPSVPQHELPTMAPDPTNGQADDRTGPASGTHVRYFGDYEIAREIARGGMGVVFQATQISLSRPVALKMILAGQLADDTDVRRFRTEAEAAANLDHPGIVPIFEVGQHEGQHYFSMGFIEGESLAQRLSEGPLPAREAAALLLKVAEAIAYAHRRGVIHRDLKPSNILIDADGNPRVTDFGLAKRVQADSGLTGSGQIMGTPSYMPPEQAGGRRGEVGPAADVYALGATLYCMVTGRPPFQAATAMDTVLQVLTEEPVPLRRLNPSVPRDLETICQKCLEKEPGKRYAGAADLGEDLRRFLAGEPILARPVTAIERAIKWARRRPAIAALSGLVALVTALGLAGVLWQWRVAVTQSELAKRRLEDALEARAQEKKQIELAEQRLYDDRMNLLQRYWENDNDALMQQGLIEQIPNDTRGVDRRGFEWFYWNRKLTSGPRPVINLNEQTRGPESVAFSSDGSQLAAGGRDHTVKIWDARTGQQTLNLKGHTHEVWSVAFSPDGSRLASASVDKTVKMWDARTGRETSTLKGHTGLVLGVAFSLDGQRLASAGSDNAVKIWDVRTGRESLTFRGHEDIVRSVAFSPDGSRLASASWDWTVRVWEAATGREVLTVRGKPATFTFSPDGKRIACAGVGTLSVWEAGTGRRLRLFNSAFKEVVSLSFSSDGKRIACAGDDEAVRVWDVETGTGPDTLTLREQAGVVARGRFTPDGKWLTAVGGPDARVKVWDPWTGQEILNFKGHSERDTIVAFSPDGRRIAFAGSDWTLKVLGGDTERSALEGHDGAIHGVAFSPDGSRLASAGADRKVKVWDVATGRETRSLDGHTSGVVSVAFSPDGSRLVSASDDRTVKVWDAGTGRETLTLAGHTKPVTSVAVSPDGMRIASASKDGRLKLWDLATGHLFGVLGWHSGSVMSVAFSPDGKWLASTGTDQRLHMWGATSGGGFRQLIGHGRSVLDVAFSPDGQQCASASADGTVKVWDWGNWREILTLKGHTKSVSSVEFSPDGKRVASGSEDGTVKLWDLATGRETLTLKGHNNKVWSVAFSRDGHRLASSDGDGTIRMWDARPLVQEGGRAEQGAGSPERRALPPLDRSRPTYVPPPGPDSVAVPSSDKLG